MELPRLDDTDTRPVHQRIAAVLREAIEDGRFAPGQRFPGENALMRVYSVARGTAREALAVLAHAGYIRTVPKIGTFVTDDKGLLRRDAPTQYTRHKASKEFDLDARLDGLDPRVDAHTDVIEAPEAIATRLGLPAGDKVVRTRYRYYANSTPVQAVTSYEVHARIAGTPIERPEAGPRGGEGIIDRYDALGIHVDAVNEDVLTRQPRGTEAEDLDIPKGVPVFEIQRTYLAQGAPLETADIVIPGDRFSLTYSIDVV